MPFDGFFPRDTQPIPTPAPLLGSLLEEIQDMAELKITLRGIWLLHYKQQGVPAVTLDEFLSDVILQRGIRPKQEPSDVSGEIRRGLRLAVRRGVFLTCKTPQGQVYFALNNESGHRAIERLKQAGADPNTLSPKSPLEPEEAPPKELPNIFALYEDNIGTIKPLIAEMLDDAATRYPECWIRKAFEMAVSEKGRGWGYIEGILKRWESEGKFGWTRGNYGDGKPRPDSPENQRQRHIEVYQRRRGSSAQNHKGRG